MMGEVFVFPGLQEARCEVWSMGLVSSAETKYKSGGQVSV